MKCSWTDLSLLLGGKKIEGGRDREKEKEREKIKKEGERGTERKKEREVWPSERESGRAVTKYFQDNWMAWMKAVGMATSAYQILYLPFLPLCTFTCLWLFIIPQPFIRKNHQVWTIFHSFSSCYHKTTHNINTICCVSPIHSRPC